MSDMMGSLVYRICELETLHRPSPPKQTDSQIEIKTMYDSRGSDKGMIHYIRRVVSEPREDMVPDEWHEDYDVSITLPSTPQDQVRQVGGYLLNLKPSHAERVDSWYWAHALRRFRDIRNLLNLPTGPYDWWVPFKRRNLSADEYEELCKLVGEVIGPEEEKQQRSA